MSKQALLNINLLAARKGAAELEFAVKKVHSLDLSKGTPDGYIKAIEKRVEELVFEEVMKFQKEDNFLNLQVKLFFLQSQLLDVFPKQFPPKYF